MKSPSEGLTAKPDDPPRIARALESADIERRMATLESTIGRLENSLLERHAKTITIIFSCMTAFVAVCAILVTILGLFSKSETHEAIKEMESKVNKSTSEMQRRFELLSGEALKKPAIQISCQSGPLDGRVFEITNSPGTIHLGPIFLKNVGDKRSDTLSVRVYSSENMQMIGPWEEVASNDRNFQFSAYLSHTTISLAPNEPWTADSSLQFLHSGQATNINFRLLVFFGGENPAEAEFLVKLKQVK